MYPPREGLQARDIARRRTTVIFFRLASISFLASSSRALLKTSSRQELPDIIGFDAFIDIDGIVMEDFGVGEWLEDGCGYGGWEEGVFVWGLIAADQGVERFARGEKPVKEGEGGGGDLNGEWGVDCGVEGELDAFD